MNKDYYKVLGIDKEASEADIKRAFRGLAYVYHPDKEGGDEKIFKKITEAYATLIDPNKRREYDQQNASKSSSNSHAGSNETRQTSSSTANTSAPRSTYLGNAAKIAAAFVVLVIIIGAALQDSDSMSVPPADISVAEAQDASQMNLIQTNSIVTSNESSVTQDVSEPTSVSLGSTGVERTTMWFSPLNIADLGTRIDSAYGYTTYSPRVSEGNLVSVSFSIANNDVIDMSIRTSSMVLVDQAGRQYGPEQVYNCEKPFKYGVQSSFLKSVALGSAVTLKPGIPCTWSMLFEVSKDSTSFNLKLGLGG